MGENGLDVFVLFCVMVLKSVLCNGTERGREVPASCRGKARSIPPPCLQLTKQCVKCCLCSGFLFVGAAPSPRLQQAVSHCSLFCRCLPSSDSTWRGGNVRWRSSSCGAGSCAQLETAGNRATTWKVRQLLLIEVVTVEAKRWLCELGWELLVGLEGQQREPCCPYGSCAVKDGWRKLVARH